MSVWQSGHPKALYYWVLQRHSLHGEAELRKVAGYYEAPRMSYGLGRLCAEFLLCDGVWVASAALVFPCA